MARGWESKSVEQQVEEQIEGRDDARRRAGSPARSGNPELHQRLEGLRLVRVRIKNAIDGSNDPAYKSMMNTAAAELDSQIGDVQARLQQLVVD